MTRALAFVADVGEGFGPYRLGDDNAILDQLTSANIACGYHAGDPLIMDATVAACVQRGVSIGAHPSFPDRGGFGRRHMQLSQEELRTDVLYQLGALHAFAVARGTRIGHVTMHGRLGNLVVKDPYFAEPVCDAIASFDPSIVVVGREGELTERARRIGIPIAPLALIDRSYIDAQTLVPRSEPNAVLTDPEAIMHRLLRLATDGVIESVDGTEIPVNTAVVLLHGDTPGSAELAGRARRSIEDAGIELVPIPELAR